MSRDSVLKILDSPHLLSFLTSASGKAGCHFNCVSDYHDLSWGNQAVLLF